MFGLHCVSRSGQLHWLAIPEISSVPASRDPRTHAYARLAGAISHPLHTTSLPPKNTHSHAWTRVIAALVPPSPPRCAWANSTIHSVSTHSPLDDFPLPPVFCHYSCVSAVGLSQSGWMDEAETQRVYREDSLASLSLPAVTPASDFHLSWAFFPPSCFSTGSLPPDKQVKCAPGMVWWTELLHILYITHRIVLASLKRSFSTNNARSIIMLYVGPVVCYCRSSSLNEFSLIQQSCCKFHIL